MGIEVIARGWDRPDWTGAFYPEDLPSEWRLSYFATTFHAVLVPLEDWRRADSEVLAGWAADVPTGFGFFMEIDPGAPDPSPVVESLGLSFRGWVAQTGRAGARAEHASDDLPAWDPEGGAIIARQAPAGLIATPRAALAWLAALAADAGGHGALAVLAGCPADGLRRWEHVVLLAGLA
jgi:hypothetical protein